jgi:prepilin-type N-terminal cleavage/methylation domain-containing protein
MSHSSSRRSGFTLVEMLIVIGIIAVLSVVIILTLNPAQLLEQNRDSHRVADLTSLNAAIGLYYSANVGSLGSTSILYVSIPDPTATSSAGDQCQGLGLPTAPSGTIYSCAASSTYRNVNGTGWIPINLSLAPGGASLSAWPVDPVNQTSSGLYYTYSTDGTDFIVTSIPESTKVKASLATSTDITNYPAVLASGQDLTISPLFSDTGLEAYWPFSEGTGTVVNDYSGNHLTGVWNGNQAGTNGYFSAGNGDGYIWAGAFDGSTTFVNTATTTLPIGNSARSVFAWAYFNSELASGCYPTVYSYGTEATSEWSELRLCSKEVNFSGWLDDWDTTLIPTLNAWHFVGYTYNPSGSMVTVYLDGQSQSGPVSPLNTILTASYASIIGADTLPGGYIPGRISGVRVYNRVLSPAEVDAMYFSEK